MKTHFLRQDKKKYPAMTGRYHEPVMAMNADFNNRQFPKRQSAALKIKL